MDLCSFFWIRLTLRKTCKSFYALVETRQIWQSLVRDLESYTTPPLEETLAEYTTAELAQWVLKRTRVRDVCRGLCHLFHEHALCQPLFIIGPASFFANSFLVADGY